MVPSGFFKGYAWDEGEIRHVPYTGNEVDYSEHWYESAALVVKPVEVNLQHTARYYGLTCAARDWLAMVGQREPSVLHEYATKLFLGQGDWTTTNDEFKDSNLFLSLLGTVWLIEYQPLLAQVMDHIGWEENIESAIGSVRSPRSCMNLVSSLLCATAPVKCRDDLMDADCLVSPSPTSFGPLPDVSTLSYLFQKTYPFTDEIVESWVAVDYWEMLVGIVAPAFVLFAQSLNQMSERMEKWRVELLTKIEEYPSRARGLCGCHAPGGRGVVVRVTTWRLFFDHPQHASARLKTCEVLTLGNGTTTSS